MFSKNNRGLSLVEIMIAVAVLGGLSVVVMKMGKMSSESVGRMKLSSDVTLTLNEISGFLSNPERCMLTFTDPSVTNDKIKPGDRYPFRNNPEKIVTTAKRFDDDPPPTPVYYLAQNWKYHDRDEAEGASGYGNSHFKIVSYELDTSGGEDFGAQLKVTIQQKKFIAEKTGEDTFTRIINMYVNRHTDGQLLGCRSLTESYDGIWTRADHNPNMIFYNPDHPAGHAQEGKPSMDPPGFVGIGTDSPSHLLHVNGSVRVEERLTANSFTYHSDERLKKNIKTIENPLDKVLNLRGVAFDWRKNNRHDLGLIAQEVVELIPEVVQSERGKEKLLSVDYARIIPFLIEAIKEQQLEIQHLQSELNELQK